MRQTQMSEVFNSVSESTIDDMWTEAMGINLSEEWTGTTRFQILRTRHLEGYKWVKGRSTKIQETTRPDSFWPVAWTQ